MNEDLKISESGLNLIKGFEDLRLEAYQDIVGVWTIGYGHTQNCNSCATFSLILAQCTMHSWGVS